jgi:hypothetical protein
MTEEHKKKIGLANKGKKRSDTFKENQRLRMLGTKQGEETKLKRSISMKKLPKRDISYLRSPENIKKNSLSRIGKPFTGTKADWNGRKHTQESKDKMSKSAKGKIISLETRKKISSSLSGENAPNWQGGKTLENYTIRHGLEYRLWRESVFKRDDFTCLECGARNGNGKKITLNADHIKSFSQFPELRFDIDNGRTLCVPCHRKTPTYGFYTGKYAKNPRAEVEY